jgi:hypothetical protein
MIRASLVHLAGLWIARDIGDGKYPPVLAVPLTVLISKLRTPILMVGVLGYALHRLRIDRRAARATDVTPRSRPSREVVLPARRPAAPPRRKRSQKKQP